ncbi:MAG: hypothetical protein QOJ16_1413 [Acidobacteriota bacterium]|jgi:hypothetical protein|nr:hypothetical protein [Acidobacteriota bacterium]
MSGWKILGSVDAQHLVNARLQLHWASQVASAVGKQLLPPQSDVSQQSFEWIDRAGALAQGTVTAARPFRSALKLAELTLSLLDAAGAPIAELPLSGRTVDEAYDWLTAEVEKLLGRALTAPFERPGPPPAMPAHPVGTGRRFALADSGPFAEVARWFADADRLLREVQAANPGASPVRCWPHHFDLATLIQLDAPPTGTTGASGAADPETARTIGAGLSPGDADRPQPYFYVTLWPYPKSPVAAELPALPGGGTWNTEGWVGAVLNAAALAGTRDQETQAREFLTSAIAACRQVAGKA